MPVKRRIPVVTYVLSLAVAVALLVVWVVYVVRSSVRLGELAGRLGMSGGRGSWILLAVGCLLFFLLIGGLTYQLAQALAAARYLHTQEEFLANITHELKSPLAAIKLHAQTLEQADLPDEVRRRSTGFVLQQADRMARLVDNVLESSRLTAQRHRLELRPIDLGEFLRGYLGEARPRIESRGVVLAAEVTTAATVMATEDALYRVMENLLDNAARFSRPGGEVRCRARDVGPLARLEVEDDGVGIPKRELPRVFDRFYRAGSGGADRLPSGTGLGLAIVSALVEEMRGRVQATSPEGRPGARFVVELPRLERAG